jgi:hypothetical protein
MLGSTVAFAAESPAKISIDNATYGGKFTYSASEKTVSITVDGTVLTEGTDFEVTDGKISQTEAGTYEATIKGIGSYTGEKTISYTIAPKAVTVKAIVNDQTFNAKFQEASIVSVKTAAGTPLIEGQDYTVVGGTHKAAGTYKVKLVGKGNFDFEETFEYTIAAKSVDVTAVVDDQTFNGKTQTAVPTNVKTAAGTALVEGEDYTVVGGSHKAAGTYKVKLVGKGNYDFTKTLEYTIAPKKVTVSATVDDQTYTGKTQTAVPTNVKTAAGTALVEGTDYTVTGGVHKAAGTYKVILKGIGNYDFTKTIEYTIAPKKVTVSATVDNQTYNGKTQTAVPTDVKTAAGTALVKGEDYTVTGGVNKNAGTYKVVIKGTGNYSFTKTISYKIAKITPTIKLAVNNSTKKFAYSGVKESAKVTVTTNNSKVKVSGNKVVISKGVKSGTKVTITVKVAATTNYNAVTKKITYTVK